MKLKELASKLGLELRGSGDAEIMAPAPVEAAGPGMIVFVATAKYAAALQSNVSAAITTAELAASAKCPTLISPNPLAEFARVLEIFFPSYRPSPGIDPAANVAPDARIGARASIGPFAVIGAGASIGADAVIHPHAVIYPKVTIGDHFICHSHATIREGCSIGNDVTILSGAVIGADGFGFVEDKGGLVKIPQTGIVVLEDGVEIGANSTVDRATIGATVLHRGVKLDDQVHIGHNCEIGEFSRFAAHVGIAGSTKIGKWCQFGGQSGCADHATIGDRVLVVAQSGLHSSVPSDTIVGGTPAVEVRKYRRYAAVLPRLSELFRRLRAVEQKIGIGGE
ncbi:MAG TPA: UDP-3-O-(3-hydroxymyristoyl)glucosamine N-acyltransferase [Candidatus Binataceae bacterium]|nr:UDP-3-O-(3-hydroxymyristoyl)glucosamine N-acyltransferase [Candidatus Binataceae bacterium]